MPASAAASAELAPPPSSASPLIAASAPAAAARSASAWRRRSRSPASSASSAGSGATASISASSKRSRSRSRSRAPSRSRRALQLASQPGDLAVGGAVARAQLEVLGRRRSRRGSPSAPRPASAGGARAGRRRRAAASRAPAGRPPTPSARRRTRWSGPRRRRDARGRSPSAPSGSRSASSASSGSSSSPSGIAKTPSTHASSAPGRTICGRARPPSSRSSECASTVLPAPVSPVIAFSPSPRRSSARSISSRFSIRSSSSIGPVCSVRADGFSRAAGAGSARLPAGAPTKSLRRTSAKVSTAPAKQDDRGDQQDVVEGGDEGAGGRVAELRRHRPAAAGGDRLVEPGRRVRGQARRDARRSATGTPRRGRRRRSRSRPGGRCC